MTEPLHLGQTQLHTIVLPLPLSLREINVYLLEGPSGAALIDTGMATPRARAALVEQLRERGLELAAIDQVFITHHHIDHFGQVDWLKEHGARVWMSRIDHEEIQYWLHHPEFDDQSLDYFRALGMPEASERRARRATAQMRRAAPLFVADHEVEDGQRIDLAGQPFEVLITPGHSPGHACLHHPATRTLLVGDHVLPHITPNISVIHQSEADPLGDYRRSLRRIRGAGYRIGLPAHGEPMAELDRRIDEILQHHDQREALLLSLLDRPLSCYQLSEGLFEMSRLDGWETMMAMGETLAHLRALQATGQVEPVHPFNRDADILFRRR